MANTKKSKTSQASPRKASRKSDAPRNGRRNRSTEAADDVVFLNIGVNRRTRAGLNKLVDVLNAANQRDVIEQLVATELHRHNLRLPRMA